MLLCGLFVCVCVEEVGCLGTRALCAGVCLACGLFVLFCFVLFGLFVCLFVLFVLFVCFVLFCLFGTCVGDGFGHNVFVLGRLFVK